MYWWISKIKGAGASYNEKIKETRKRVKEEGRGVFSASTRSVEDHASKVSDPGATLFVPWRIIWVEGAERRQRRGQREAGGGGDVDGGQGGHPWIGSFLAGVWTFGYSGRLDDGRFCDGRSGVLVVPYGRLQSNRSSCLISTVKTREESWWCTGWPYMLCRLRGREGSWSVLVEFRSNLFSSEYIVPRKSLGPCIGDRPLQHSHDLVT